jgi:pimeloyl-ACP methyl ester carboxylesterase
MSATGGPVMPTAADFEACLAEPARVVQTGRGPVEVADRGDGLPLLSLHGSPAAYENGVLLAEFARVGGFRVIAPSRPGYGGTPLDTGRTPAEQADAVAGLLDTLGLDKVTVLGSSGGGPVGYALAGRHPGRVGCLLQVDAISLPVPAPRLGRLGLRLRHLSILGVWLLDRFPARMLTTLGAPGTTDPDVLAAQAALGRGLITSGTGWDRLGAGYDNEANRFATLEPLPLRDITCPTLIIHGTADTRVPVSHAEYAHASIENSHLRLIDGGGHTAFLFNPEMQHQARTWLSDQQNR